MTPEEIFKNWIKNNLNQEISFNKFVYFLETYNDKPAKNIQELKNKNNKKKVGDLFEVFCKYYLLILEEYDNVWLLKDIPDNVKQKLNLSKNDMGIDLIGIKNNKYYAIQSKYRKKNIKKKTTSISWKSLSTFYALVYRTGPYEKHVVMTNVDCVRHVGKKTTKDKSICLKKFQKLKFSNWFDILKKISNDNINIKKTNDEDYKLNLEELRLKRILFFSKKN